MIQFSDEFRIQHLIGSLVRGRILKVKFDRTYLSDPKIEARHKFVIVLNSPQSDDPVLFVFTTSQVERFADFDGDIVTIPAGLYGCFPLDTALDCREVHEISIERLKDRCHSDELTFEGQLSKEDLETVLETVQKSRLISRRQKRRILGRETV